MQETLGSISSNSHTMVLSETNKKKLEKSHKTINIQICGLLFVYTKLKSNSNLKDLAWRDLKIVLFKI